MCSRSGTTITNSSRFPLIVAIVTIIYPSILLAVVLDFAVSQLKSALESTDEEFEQNYVVKKPHKHDTTIIFYGLCEIKGATAVQLAHKLGYKL